MYDMHSIYIYTLYIHMYIHMRNVCMRMDLKPRRRWSRNMGRRRDAETRIVHPAGWRWRGTHIPCSTLISLIHIFWWRKSHWKFHESPFFRVEHPVSMVEKSHEIANLAGWNLHFFHVFFCRTAFQAEAGPSNTSHWAKHHFFWGDQWWYRDYRDIDI